MSRKDKIKEVLDLMDASILKAADILQSIMEDYKEPCVHEPQGIPKWAEDVEFFRLSAALEHMHRCKHCGVKIKAEKWIEE